MDERRITGHAWRVARWSMTSGARPSAPGSSDASRQSWTLFRAVASVTSGGLVTAVGNGQAQIAASASGVAGTAAITVAQEVAAVTVAQGPAVLLPAGGASWW